MYKHLWVLSDTKGLRQEAEEYINFIVRDRFINTSEDFGIEWTMGIPQYRSLPEVRVCINITRTGKFEDISTARGS